MLHHFKQYKQEEAHRWVNFFLQFADRGIALSKRTKALIDLSRKIVGL
jgi:hypothetical protein